MWYLIECGVIFWLEEKASIYTRIIFYSSWLFPQPSGSTGHQHISPCQVQRHPLSAPSRWDFWVACENSYTWAANTWHHYAGNTGTWSTDAFAGAAAAWWMSTRCRINISYQETVFLALFLILEFHQMSFNNWGSEMDMGLQEITTFCMQVFAIFVFHRITSKQ